MKKYLLLVAFGLLLAKTTTAQETVVWGNEVIDVSSEFSPYEYSAVQALNKPNVLPNSGDDPNAWRPKSSEKEEFLMVSFNTPIRAKQVAIAESENPGAVKQVYAYDSDYNEYLLFELTPRSLPIESRLLNIFFELTEYKIQAIKVIIDGSASEGYNSIDAIGISSSNIPINVLINLARGLNDSMEADRLSQNVNSTYVEHSPIISPDGKRLYFSRQFHPGNTGGEDDSEDIWVSEKDEVTGEWLPATNVGPPLNTKGPNFISSISVVDGKEIIVLGNRYGKKGRMFTGVSMATRDENGFSDPVAVEIENEYNYSPNADFFLVPGGEAMVISAERDDTYGMRDLYVCFKKKDGTWTEPKNLGNDINTIGEDESPFMAQDGKTLYFSSDGYSGYGGADIYVSFKLDDTWTKWSAPENLGPGINKDGDDEYFSIPSSGTNLYFTRAEKGEDSDIFTFRADALFIDPESPLIASVQHLREQTIPDVIVAKEEEPKVVLMTVSGKVLNAKTNQPIEGAKVIIERLPDGAEIGTAETEADGSYTFTVRAGARFGIRGEADGFIAEDQNVDFSDNTESAMFAQDLLIFPAEKGEKIVLNNIFFDFDKSELKTASYPELNRILDYLKADKIGAILVSGHTDSTGEADYNMKLSGRRAKAVVDFFIKNGISRDRLEYKAFGETQPAFSNDVVANKKKNRRVEFEIK
ncbi:MAG: OmpA family protein [Bacteroidota bacterium]